MINNRRWLVMAEYVSLSGSVVGSVFAAISQQFIYVTTPVCVSLLLNLLNRRHLEDLNRQMPVSSQLEQNVANIQAAQEQWTHELRGIIERLENQAQDAGSGPDLTPVVSAIKQLRSQQQGLEQSLRPIQAQLDTLSQQFTARPELEQIESLTRVILALQQCIDGLPAQTRVVESSPISSTQVVDIEQQVVQAISRIPALVEAAVQRRLDKSEEQSPTDKKS